MKKIEIQDEACIANNVFIGAEVIIKKRSCNWCEQLNI